MHERSELLKLAGAAGALALALAGCARPHHEPLLVPPLADGGCWARFYEQPQFGAPVREIEGPNLMAATAGRVVEVPDIQETAPQPLFAEARSLEVGPSATLTGYADTMFRGAASELAPGTRVAEARSVGYPERFASFKIHCNG